MLTVGHEWRLAHSAVRGAASEVGLCAASPALTFTRPLQSLNTSPHEHMGAGARGTGGHEWRRAKR
jgi:hypothetical protein